MTGKKLVVVYDPENGTAFPDGGAETAVQVMLRTRDDVDVWTVGNETVIYRLRLAVAEGEIEHTDVEIRDAAGTVFPLTEYGTFKAEFTSAEFDLPGSLVPQWAERILRAVARRRREKGGGS